MRLKTMFWAKDHRVANQSFLENIEKVKFKAIGVGNRQAWQCQAQMGLFGIAMLNKNPAGYFPLIRYIADLRLVSGPSGCHAVDHVDYFLMSDISGN